MMSQSNMLAMMIQGLIHRWKIGSNNKNNIDLIWKKNVYLIGLNYIYIHFFFLFLVSFLQINLKQKNYFLQIINLRFFLNSSIHFLQQIQFPILDFRKQEQMLPKEIAVPITKLTWKKSILSLLVMRVKGKYCIVVIIVVIVL